MNWFKNHRIVFNGFLISVVIVFFYTRPVNSPWHPYIAGDGLGYYAYLPAAFIHHDARFEFKWFNKVHDRHYAYSTFPNPEDNFMVPYGNKRINKYYQGLSYVWLPFFALGHISAIVLNYPADGFSQPYQFCIGLASLVYLLIGLFFLKKLLHRLFNDEWIATLTPAVVFYGTWLFTYAIHYNSLSHVYSFTCIVLFLYFLHSFCDNRNARVTHLLLCVLFLVICVCIRPLNGIVILLAPAFVPFGFLRQKIRFPRFNSFNWFVVLLTAGALFNQFAIAYAQTNSFFVYAYTNEKFHFEQSRFVDVLLSYHAGLFVYVPLVLLSLCGIPFLPLKKRILLPAFFFLVLFIYSSWWYWSISRRALVDFYVIPAVMLAALFYQVRQRQKLKVALSIVAVLCVGYFQLKNLQMQRGVLDENYTYREIFWQNFFRIKKTTLYLVPPATIIKEQTHKLDFENTPMPGISGRESHGGARALLIDSANYICKVVEYPAPAFFKSKGHLHVRLSYWCYFSPGVGSLHVFMHFYDSRNKALLEVPFYVNKEDISPGTWDRMEFGHELTAAELPLDSLHHIGFTFWNVEGKKPVFIDDVRTDFILADDQLNNFN